MKKKVENRTFSGGMFILVGVQFDRIAKVGTGYVNYKGYLFLMHWFQGHKFFSILEK